MKPLFLSIIVLVLLSMSVFAIEGSQVCQNPDTKANMRGDACKNVCLKGSSFVWCEKTTTATQTQQQATTTLKSNPTEEDVIAVQEEAWRELDKLVDRDYGKYELLNDEFEAMDKEYFDKLAELTTRWSVAFGKWTPGCEECETRYRAEDAQIKADTAALHKEYQQKYYELGEKAKQKKEGAFTKVGRWFRNIFGKVFYKETKSETTTPRPAY